MRRRYGTPEQGKRPAGKWLKWEKSRGIRLKVSLALLLCALVLRLVFPAVADSIVKACGLDKDYVSAISQLGETVNGERDIKQVFGELYSRAFGISEEDRYGI